MTYANMKRKRWGESGRLTEMMLINTTTFVSLKFKFSENNIKFERVNEILGCVHVILFDVDTSMTTRHTYIFSLHICDFVAIFPVLCCVIVLNSIHFVLISLDPQFNFSAFATHIYHNFASAVVGAFVVVNHKIVEGSKYFKVCFENAWYICARSQRMNVIKCRSLFPSCDVCYFSYFIFIFTV